MRLFKYVLGLAVVGTMSASYAAAQEKEHLQVGVYGGSVCHKPIPILSAWADASRFPLSIE
jgi:hypothetical protein